MVPAHNLGFCIQSASGCDRRSARRPSDCLWRDCSRRVARGVQAKEQRALFLALSQLVRALLLLSQAETGQIVLQKSRLNLCEVVEDQVDQFQIPAEAAGVRLTAQLPPQCSAEVDRVQIERMITNLLSNALKFTPEGGAVTMSLQVEPQFIELVVEDNGRGIPTEHLPHIFDRFYRVPGQGTAPSPEQGLGLGLSFVAWIVKAHNGKIEVESTPGKGTRFIIRLPNEGVGSDTLELAGQPAGY